MDLGRITWLFFKLATEPVQGSVTEIARKLNDGKLNGYVIEFVKNMIVEGCLTEDGTGNFRGSTFKVYSKNKGGLKEYYQNSEMYKMNASLIEVLIEPLIFIANVPKLKAELEKARTESRKDGRHRVH